MSKPRRAEEVEMDEGVEKIQPPWGSFTQISTLRKTYHMLFPENKDKKYILKCPVALMKCSFNLRPAVKRAAAKLAVVMTPILRPSQFSLQGSQITMHPPTFTFLMNNLTCFVVWNIRGAPDAALKRNLRELVHSHNPCMVGLLETRMEEHASLKEEMGFDDFLEVPAIDRSGGVVLMWKTNMVIVTCIRQADQELHAMIEVPVEEVGESSGNT